MRAIEAQRLAYEGNIGKKLLKRFLPKIQAAARKGEFEIQIKMGDSSDSYVLKDELEKLGYKVGQTSAQCSPNDSWYFLRINWSDDD